MVVVGFVLLIKGADLLVSGASSLAKQLSIPDLAIGLTIVAMGTSAPELVVNIISGTTEQKDLDEVVFGNIIGSNLFNVFIILGFASIIYPIGVQSDILKKDVPYSIFTVLLLTFFINDHYFFGTPNLLSLWESIVLLIVFVGFLYLTFLQMRKGTMEEGESEGEEIEVYGGLKSFLFIIFGIIGLVFGGEFVVDNSVELAEHYGVPEKVIGLTILAAGTSLPELATSCVAAFQRKPDLAVGNVMGSNIFNMLLVLGVSGVLSERTGGPLKYDTELNADMGVFFVGLVLMVIFMFTFKTRKIDREEGVIFLVAYALYSIFVIVPRI